MAKPRMWQWQCDGSPRWILEHAGIYVSGADPEDLWCRLWYLHEVFYPKEYIYDHGAQSA